MFIKQISIILDNVPGAMGRVSEILGREGVNIRAISVADTSDISTVRFVVDDPVKALNILKANGFSTKETDVLAVETPDHPGGLNAVLKPLKEAGINAHFYESPGTAHEWQSWRRSLREFAQLLFQTR